MVAVGNWQLPVTNRATKHHLWFWQLNHRYRDSGRSRHPTLPTPCHLILYERRRDQEGARRSRYAGRRELHERQIEKGGSRRQKRDEQHTLNDDDAHTCDIMTWCMSRQFQWTRRDPLRTAASIGTSRSCAGSHRKQWRDGPLPTRCLCHSSRV